MSGEEITQGQSAKKRKPTGASGVANKGRKNAEHAEVVDLEEEVDDEMVVDTPAQKPKTAEEVEKEESFRDHLKENGYMLGDVEQLGIELDTPPLGDSKDEQGGEVNELEAWQRQNGYDEEEAVTMKSLFSSSPAQGAIGHEFDNSPMQDGFETGNTEQLRLGISIDSSLGDANAEQRGEEVHFQELLWGNKFEIGQAQQSVNGAEFNYSPMETRSEGDNATLGIIGEVRPIFASDKGEQAGYTEEFESFEARNADLGGQTGEVRRLIGEDMVVQTGNADEFDIFEALTREHNFTLSNARQAGIIDESEDEFWDAQAEPVDDLEALLGENTFVVDLGEQRRSVGIESTFEDDWEANLSATLAEELAKED